MTRLTEADVWQLAADHLTAKQLRALELRHRTHHTYTEIALELGITVAAAQARVRSAEHRLRILIAHRKEAA